MPNLIEPATLTEAQATAIPGTRITYKDLKAQRLAVGIDAMIYAFGDFYNQESFRETFSGGKWEYDAERIKIFDKVKQEFIDVTPSDNGNPKRATT